MKNIGILILLALALSSCEKEIEIDMPAYTPSLVVEGFIVNDMAPVILLTKNIEYTARAGRNLYSSSFIHDAFVTIEYNGIVDTLKEITQEDPATGMKTYLYSSAKTVGVIGETYVLNIRHAGKIYSASAKIPVPVAIQDMWFEKHPKETNDSLKTVWIKINDPLETNYYRYITEVNGGHSVQAEMSTVNDNAFNGKEYVKAIDSGLKNEEQDMHGGVSGYFRVGDTITVKWANVEKSYYDTWTSIDFKRSQNQNPFMNPTRIVGNIDGCLGYWSGMGVNAKSIILK